MKDYFASRHNQRLSGFDWAAMPLCWGYGLATNLRNLAYNQGWIRPVKLSVPVISVGNLTTGGTGKSPVTIALGQYLTGHGKRVVILNRGYGATQTLDYGQPTGPQHGDEAWMIQQAVPQSVVIVGRNRVANALHALVEFSPDVILLDDGFQHRKLSRDLDIVLIHGQSRFGNGHLLPLGPLREPLSGLKRATDCWVTYRQQQEAIENRMALPVPFIPVGYRQWGTQTILDESAFHGHRGIGVCGIALPQSFRASLEQAQVIVQAMYPYADHHVYTAEDIRRIEQLTDQGLAIFSTEKDRVKLEAGLSPTACQRIYSLLLQPQLPPQTLAKINALCGIATPQEASYAR